MCTGRFTPTSENLGARMPQVQAADARPQIARLRPEYVTTVAHAARVVFSGYGLQGREIEPRGGPIDIEPHHLAGGIDIDIQAFGHLAHLGPRFRFQFDIQLSVSR